MLRQLCRHHPSLRSPLKISSAHYAKYKKAAIEKEKEREILYKDKALKSFDDLYQKIYKNHWPSMRLGLLCPTKTGLLVNNFGDTGRIMNDLEDKGLLFVSSLIEERRAELAALKDETDSDSENDLSSIRDRDRHGEETDNYFKKSKSDGSDEVDAENPHLSKKIHEDPTVNVPLEETLAAAKIDRSRIIEPHETGTALSAALFEFIPATELMGKDPEWVLSSDQFREYEKSSAVLVDVEPEKELHFPPTWLLYSYERGNVMDYEPPKMGLARTIGITIFVRSGPFPSMSISLPKDYKSQYTSRNQAVPIIDQLLGILASSKSAPRRKLDM